MSPGTSPTESTSSTRPDRRTRAMGTWSWASASTLAIALRSWLVPMITLNRTSAMTMAPVGICPIAKLAMLTMSNMMFMGLSSWPFATSQSVGGGSTVISFCPYCVRRRRTSSASSPFPASTARRATVSSADSAYQGASVMICSDVVTLGLLGLPWCP